MSLPVVVSTESRRAEARPYSLLKRNKYHIVRQQMVVCFKLFFALQNVDKYLIHL